MLKQERMVLSLFDWWITFDNKMFQSDLATRILQAACNGSAVRAERGKSSPTSFGIEVQKPCFASDSKQETTQKHLGGSQAEHRCQRYVVCVYETLATLSAATKLWVCSSRRAQPHPGVTV